MFSIFQKAALPSIAFLMAAGVSSAADSIVIKGSTTVLPVAQGTLEAFMKANPGVQMSLSGGGSGEGIKALIDKTPLRRFGVARMMTKHLNRASSL